MGGKSKGGTQPPRLATFSLEEDVELLSSRSSLDSSSTSPTLPSHHHRPSPHPPSAHARYPSIDQWMRKAPVHIPSRYQTWFRNTATLLLLLYTAVALFFLYWVTRFFLLRHHAYAHSVFAQPMIPDPFDVETLVPPLSSSHSHSATSLSALQSELDTRLSGLGLPKSTLKCEWNGSKDEEKYGFLKEDGPYFFAINLWNNEVVFPSLSRTLLSLADFLGPSNIAISIFENGSTDNTTMAMAHLAAVLTTGKVKHTILSDERSTNWKKVDRIAQLSVYRNVALEPLREVLPSGREFTEVIFVNDVFVCPRDTLELLYQKKIQKADATCGMDWRASNSWLQKWGLTNVSPKYYDNWVGRTITGDMFRPRLDLFSESRNGLKELFNNAASLPTRERFEKALPFPVYSCWNGMLTISAAPFRGDHGAKLVKFRSAFNKPGECAASECKTVARDFWAQKLSKWVVVPSVHVTYVQSVYTHPALLSLRPSPTTPPEDQLIDWSKVSTPETVVCYEYLRGFHIDSSTREPPF